MVTAIWVQILDGVVRISHSTNPLQKRRNSSILPLAWWKILGQTGFFKFSAATGKEK